MDRIAELSLHIMLAFCDGGMESLIGAETPKGARS